MSLSGPATDVVQRFRSKAQTSAKATSRSRTVGDGGFGGTEIAVVSEVRIRVDSAVSALSMMIVGNHRIDIDRQQFSLTKLDA